MNRLATFFQRRSLTFAAIAFLFGLEAFGRVFNFGGLAHRHGPEYVEQSLISCVMAFVLCTAVLANLVLDVGRGYSPNRCQLAAVIMLAAFAGPVMLALTLVSYYSR